MPILSSLHIYPIKSCAGIALQEATVTAAGLMTQHVYDREWMVVDENGDFLTQRHHPRMALITPRIKSDTLELRAPGMLPIEIPLDLPHPDEAHTRQVQVWKDTVIAYDCDDTTAFWFSRFLGLSCRLVRFHTDAKRNADANWTQGIEAPTMFGDGFPLLVVSEGSLVDLNGKLQAQGREPLPMNRFRPNLVLDGISAFEEDFASTIRVGDAVIKPAKPCARCEILSVDQATGEFGPDPLDILRTYRVNEKVDGGICFGMNAVLLKGDGQVLRVGVEIDVELAF